MANPTSTAVDLVDLHRRAGVATRVFVASVRPDQLIQPTNCEWDIRGLLNHIVSGNWWAAELVNGKTIAEVGGRLDGDLLGVDVLGAYDASLAAAQAAFAEPGALGRICRLSYGDLPGAVYASHRLLDIFIHGWDIATATGQDDTLDPRLATTVRALFEPHMAELQASGQFGQLVRPPAGANAQTRLLAMTGRRA
ncbi:MAG TPA: TIGR03086 family metal-binding protein [Chloroflexota bacterium]|nr:TIGR03086 family metal-binding protein [Chloroflexota bacterium]